MAVVKSPLKATHGLKRDNSQAIYSSFYKNFIGHPHAMATGDLDGHAGPGVMLALIKDLRALQSPNVAPPSLGLRPRHEDA